MHRHSDHVLRFRRNYKLTHFIRMRCKSQQQFIIFSLRSVLYCLYVLSLSISPINMYTYQSKVFQTESERENETCFLFHKKMKMYRRIPCTCTVYQFKSYVSEAQSYDNLFRYLHTGCYSKGQHLIFLSVFHKDKRLLKKGIFFPIQLILKRKFTFLEINSLC